jgi:hypothetical protein
LEDEEDEEALRAVLLLLVLLLLLLPVSPSSVKALGLCNGILGRLGLPSLRSTASFSATARSAPDVRTSSGNVSRSGTRGIVLAAFPVCLPVVSVCEVCVLCM